MIGLTMEKETRRLTYFLVAVGMIFISFIIRPPEGLSSQGVTMLAITLGAALLWMTEALSCGTTGLAIIFAEALTGIMPLSAGLAYLAHPVNAIVLVGFLLGAILVKSGLDMRIGLTIISKMGEKTDRIILGLMIATAFLSMWMSNTATTAIMLPIGLGILNMAGVKPLKSNLGKAMIIGIAYAANIGGMATPTGTPANPIAMAFLADMAGIRLSFLGWMLRALPVVVILVPLTWLALLKIHPLEIAEVKGGLDAVTKQLQEKGPLTKQEKKVLYFFIIAIILWLMDSVIPLTEDWLYIVSMFLTIVIVVPKLGFLTWKEAEKEISWDIILLSGGGLAMGAGLRSTGVVEWLAMLLSSGIGQIPPELAVFFTTLITGGIGITLFCTISSTTTTFVPLAIGLALSFGWDPVTFGVAACLSSSFAFLLPANSAPNALAFGTGYIKTSDLMKSGLFQLGISVLVVSVLAVYLLPVFR